jgi:hypothetical protein
MHEESKSMSGQNDFQKQPNFVVRSSTDTTSGSDAKAAEYVNSVLQPGEEVAWAGRPTAWTFAKKGGITSVLIGGFLCAVAIVSITSSGTQIDGQIFLLLFLAIGFWTVLTPIRNALRALWTYYAITNRRIMIVRMFPGKKVTSIHRSQFQNVERTDHGNDIGTVTVKTTTKRRRHGTHEVVTLDDGLFGISRFQSAMDAIWAMQENRGS